MDFQSFAGRFRHHVNHHVLLFLPLLSMVSRSAAASGILCLLAGLWSIQERVREVEATGAVRRFCSCPVSVIFSSPRAKLHHCKASVVHIVLVRGHFSGDEKTSSDVSLSVIVDPISTHGGLKLLSGGYGRHNEKEHPVQLRNKSFSCRLLPHANVSVPLCLVAVNCDIGAEPNTQNCLLC